MKSVNICEISERSELIYHHRPVLIDEVIENLNLTPGKVVLDATIGEGGHSIEIFKKILPGGRLIGLDRDIEALKVSEQRLKPFQKDLLLILGNFRDLDKILESQRVKDVDGILFDLGVSSFQLENPERGFSIKKDGPLDMRMDRSSGLSAFDIVNRSTEEELSMLIRDFGEERFHRRIARRIVKMRKRSPIATTNQLRDLVLKAIPHRAKFYRLHPATRTFLALRLKVNEELDSLAEGLDKAVNSLAPKGRLCVISFHSLEDRIAKRTFIDYSHSGIIRLINKKPITPGAKEIKSNPRARSAKLRVVEKI